MGTADLATADHALLYRRSVWMRSVRSAESAAGADDEGPYFQNAPGRITKGRWKNWIGPLMTLAVIVAVLYSFHLLIALAVWYGALLTSFWAFFRLRTWTEHGGIIENGETTHRIRLSFVERILITPHASWSHYEHHAHPGIPFWSRHKICEPNARTKSLWYVLGSFGG